MPFRGCPLRPAGRAVRLNPSTRPPSDACRDGSRSPVRRDPVARGTAPAAAGGPADGHRPASHHAHSRRVAPRPPGRAARGPTRPTAVAPDHRLPPEGGVRPAAARHAGRLRRDDGGIVRSGGVRTLPRAGPAEPQRSPGQGPAGQRNAGVRGAGHRHRRTRHPDRRPAAGPRGGQLPPRHLGAGGAGVRCATRDEPRLPPTAEVAGQPVPGPERAANSSTSG